MTEGIPLDEENASAAARSVLDHAGADDVEVVLLGSETGITRYARSEIIQNTTRREIRGFVRVVVGDRSATATTNQLSREHLSRAADSALEAAKAAPEDPDWHGLARPDEVGRADPIRKWDQVTAEASPGDRARSIAEIVAAAGENAAGVFETSAHSYGVFTSTGIHCFDANTRCVATCLVDTGESTGWAEASSHAVGQVDPAEPAQRAAKKAAMGMGAIDLTPDNYDVLLEAPAAAVLIDYLAFSGFGAKQVLEGESFLATRKGQTVASSSVTIADDAGHPASIGIGFDFEGVPRKRAVVIDHGVALDPLTDMRTAAKLGLPLTGHGSGSNEVGPYAANVVLEAGDTPAEDLKAGITDGLLVTRFHYVNVLDRPSTLMTGMTRDGTFRIRNGEIAEPVHNLRFTQSALGALASTVAVGDDLRLFAPEWTAFGSTAAPSLRIADFRFTSATTH
ncbi:MAG: TldD/PmbA family protein [Actinomycetota bacterium]|nr:TldD/PmbA family protein [Actinomycetota bacterium]